MESVGRYHIIACVIGRVPAAKPKIATGVGQCFATTETLTARYGLVRADAGTRPLSGRIIGIIGIPGTEDDPANATLIIIPPSLTA
jgi:hypothetical protein